LTDKQLLYVMRISVVGVTLMSVMFTLFNQSIYELVRQSSEISLVSLFVPLVAGLYWKSATSWGAIGSMLVGMVVWMVCTYLKTEYPTIIYGLLSSIVSMIFFSFLEQKMKPRIEELG
jgi:solute:Na+ symporter, SSS family